MEKKYLDLAEQMFEDLKEELLNIDRKILGGTDENNFVIDGNKITIKITQAFWEKSDWYSFEVYDVNNKLIYEKTVC
ncbi:MAG: hypothetical protein ACRC8Z_03920 [Empedobacter falsenii]